MNRQITRKILLLLCICLLLLTGCFGPKTGDTAVPEETNQLSLYLPKTWASSKIEQAIYLFKQAYPDVEVDIRHIGSGDDKASMEEYTQILQNEVMAGSGPDVIVISSELDDIYKVMKAGVFADMKPLMEQDTETDFSSYHSAVLEGGVLDGKQYLMPLTYSVPVLLTSQQRLQDAGFDLSDDLDCDAFLDQIADYAQTLDASEDTRVFEDSYPLSLKRLLDYCGVSCLDYSTGKVNVATEEFRKVVECYKSLYQSQYQVPKRKRENADGLVYSSNADGLEQLLKKEALFSLSRCQIPENFFLTAQGVTGGGETPLVSGIPSFHGGLTATVDLAAGIRAASPNKLNAYRFITLLMQVNQVMDKFTYYPLSTNPSFMEEVMEHYHAEYGEISVLQSPDGGESWPLKKVSDSVVDAYSSTIQNVSNVVFVNEETTLENYLQDCMTPYLEGTATYEACLTDLESKLMIYASE